MYCVAYKFKSTLVEQSNISSFNDEVEAIKWLIHELAPLKNAVYFSRRPESKIIEGFDWSGDIYRITEGCATNPEDVFRYVEHAGWCLAELASNLNQYWEQGGYYSSAIITNSTMPRHDEEEYVSQMPAYEDCVDDYEMYRYV